MVEQGSPEWKAMRLGKVTASRIGDIMATTKSGPSASRENYMVELALQRVTGVAEESFTSPAMKWGIEQEPFARMAYEAQSGEIVQEVDFIDHPSIPLCGASPDGLVGDDGLVEIKCPDSKEHLRILRDGAIKDSYMLQMLWQMECTNRKWCDFVSYDPRFPDWCNVRIVRVFRVDPQLEEIRKKVREFENDVSVTVQKIRAMKKAA